jgi:hypothetical protein
MIRRARQTAASEHKRTRASITNLDDFARGFGAFAGARAIE